LIRLIALFLLLQATLSVRTVVVVLPVTVTDGRGRRVTGLTQGDFRVHEDGRLQPVTLFHHGTGPITLGLAVDHSGSMRDNISGVTAAVGAFGAITFPEDQLFVIGFNDRLSQPLAARGSPFTNDAREIAAAVGSIPTRGQTALYDAVVAGLERAKQGRWDKRSLVIVSDGGDNVSRYTADEVEALARESDVVIYAIGLRGMSEEQSPRILRRLAENTGGTAYFPRRVDDVAGVLREIVTELREQYTLGFSPDTANGVFRRIAVTATRPDGRALRVRTRAGYLVPADPR
jgi:Ca-activated chloride channel family protein